MKISSVSIKNFRSFDDCTVFFSDYTALVGPNGAGKSTVLCALNIFFREIEGSTTNVSELDIEDYHQRNTGAPIEITVTFDDLSPEAQKDFSDYVRHGELVITAKAEFDKNTGVGTVKQFGQRRAMARFRRFFELYNGGKSAADLKAEFAEIKSEFPDLAEASTKDAMKESLRNYEEGHPDKCDLIPSEDQFYGFSKGTNRLARYVQWIYVPAVKDATKENIEAKNTALGKILARTVRSKVQFDEQIKQIKDETLQKYRDLLSSQQSTLDEISNSLTARLNQWAHPEASARLAWTEDPKKSVQVDEPVARLLAGEGTFEGDLARFGHGLQRSYLLALLQELASSDDSGAPTLVLGCEEPELYQHPPQARHLANVFEKLSAGNAQILVSTHSPYFVSGRHFESLRLVRRDLKAKASGISSVDFDALADRISTVTGEKPLKPAAQQARLQQALQPHLNEMFFASKLVFVEGLEDVAYITAHLVLSGRWDEFRRHGAHIIPTNGKSYLIEPVIVAEMLSIPAYVVFDADGGISNPSNRPKHEKDNKALLSLLGGDSKTPFPTSTVWNDNFVVWVNNLGDTLKSEIGQSDWDKTFGKATKELGDPEGSFAKNPLHIGHHLDLLHAKNKLPPSLEKLSSEIIRFVSTA